MSIAFLTLGYVADIVMPTLIESKDLKKVYIYYGSTKKAFKKVKKTIDKLENSADNMGIDVVKRKVDDPYDFLGYLRLMAEDTRYEKSKGSILEHYNISGGTRPASVAGLVVAAFFGIPVMMRQTKSGDMIDFPLIKTAFRITENEREILRNIIKEDEGITQSELADLMDKKHRSTVHRPVKNMVGRNVLFLEEDPEDSRRKIIKINKMVKILLGE